VNEVKFQCVTEGVSQCENEKGTKCANLESLE